MTCRLELERTVEKPKPVLVDANQIQQETPRRPLPPSRQEEDHQRLLIKQPMNTIEAVTILDDTINSLGRALNLYATRYNRPLVTLPNSSLQTQELPETSQATPQPSENSNIVIEAYKDESQMPDIMRVITKELSEPYSIYTYRFFIHNWPELCLLARDTVNNCNIGVIVCKLDHDPKWRRGYIAMLAVEETYRRRGIGKLLVQRSIEVMREKGCDEVMLEAEVTNASALTLYDRLGFIRERRLYRYYLNGSDAFRLKLLFADCWPEENPIRQSVDLEEIPNHPTQQRATEVV